MNHNKIIKTTLIILITLAILGLSIWLGGGVVIMVKNHLGM
jgi:hypothetical protein